jgi:hypothetical protein
MKVTPAAPAPFQQLSVSTHERFGGPDNTLVNAYDIDFMRFVNGSETIMIGANVASYRPWALSDGGGDEFGAIADAIRGSGLLALASDAASGSTPPVGTARITLDDRSWTASPTA